MHTRSQARLLSKIRAPRVRCVQLVFACILATGLLSSAGAQSCGSLANDDFGPFDYRKAAPENLQVVESYHFTPSVESLSQGTTTFIGGDIDYTLRAFPNHPRALLAMVRLAEREKRDPPEGARYTVKCWLDRAAQFAPDDGQVQMVYGYFLARASRPDQAIKKLERAYELIGENANVHYNLGLVYADLKEYDKALHHAHEAYRLGFSLPGLRNRLAQAGKWREPNVIERATPSSAK